VSAAVKARPKLNGAIANTIVTKVNAYARAKAAFDKAKAAKDTLASYAHLIPAETGAEGAGHIIKHWMGGGGQLFELSEYLKAGHAITPEMAPFVKDRSRYHQWSIKPIDGPPEQE
jgi:hypothetical protein